MKTYPNPVVRLLYYWVKITLILIIGFLFGLILHGIIEIPVIWFLINVFENLFLKFSWKTWVLIHHIFSIIIEVLSVIFIFWIFKRYEQDFTKKEKI